MRYRALREYRDNYPDLVIVHKTDDFPALTAALEKNIPADVRKYSRPAQLLRNHADTAWCRAAPGQTYLVYTMAGEAVDLDLTSDNGRYQLSWLDSASGELRAAGSVVGGKIVTLAPPATDAVKRPWVAWLTRR